VLKRRGFGLRHLAPEVVRREVGVPLCLTDRPVPENLLERVEITAPHHERRRERVPEIVEAEVFDLRSATGSASAAPGGGLVIAALSLGAGVGSDYAVCATLATALLSESQIWKQSR
jgi:hypothetical protein